MLFSPIVYTIAFGIFVLVGQPPKMVLIFFVGGAICLIIRTLVEMPLRAVVVKMTSSGSEELNNIFRQATVWSFLPPTDPELLKLWIKGRHRLWLVGSLGTGIFLAYVTSWVDHFFPEAPSAKAGLFWLFGITVWCLRLAEDAMTYLGRNLNDKTRAARTVFLEVKGTFWERIFSTILGFFVAIPFTLITKPFVSFLVTYIK